MASGLVTSVGGPQRLPATGHHMTGLTENLNRVMSISKTGVSRAAQESAAVGMPEADSVV